MQLLKVTDLCWSSGGSSDRLAVTACHSTRTFVNTGEAISRDLWAEINVVAWKREEDYRVHLPFPECNSPKKRIDDFIFEVAVERGLTLEFIPEDKTIAIEICEGEVEAEEE